MLCLHRKKHLTIIKWAIANIRPYGAYDDLTMKCNRCGKIFTRTATTEYIRSLIKKINNKNKTKEVQ